MNMAKLDEKRKRALLNAALKEFTAKGYDEASTNVIAKDAKISKALMFHYVGNKQELFLFLYDYFEDILAKEYYGKINLQEKDLFNRLKDSYLLQIDLIKQYPWILAFDNLSVESASAEINKRIQQTDRQKKVSECFQLFDGIDLSKFRTDLDIEKCKQFILWSNIGFTNQILADLKNQDGQHLNEEKIISTLDGYFEELRKIFYLSGEEP
ncbi:TetR/AcrR family transcriptional regulator [Vagococcus sp. BWB3-3]|uniref:TetR/AcrR family transcriptional regulator n=1 Tax=Vagococcus allomyrinae TaxID=2794353 RepID=A0A940P815_9ENTE|nr:TetR/AcrR family transcriptional regulator [Vagococcus allomyrinae]MBP1043384.1 TetR/AcrR family transcriptional regulator [Vagococcus allomyrinae]